MDETRARNKSSTAAPERLMKPAFLKIEFIPTKEKRDSKDKQGLNCSVEFDIITLLINDMCRFVCV